jgi:hypothetical protein
VEASSNCPFPIKGRSSSVGNYRPTAILNNSAKAFITYDHVSHFLKSKLNSSQHVLPNLNLLLPIQLLSFTLLPP